MGQNVQTVELRPDASGNNGNTSTAPVIKRGEEIGRNDQCPCGSGKKYKNCGLKNTEEHQKLIAGK
jgi:preprotein translocase subunit SecA